jgi:hypothetical protein
MQAFYLIIKFLACLGYYLFWGRSGLAIAFKISFFVVWLLSLLVPLSETTRLTFGKEASTPMLSWETETWIKVGIGALALFAAIGAACVRVKSLIFKVDNELKLSPKEKIFRLTVERRGWLVDVEAPPAKVQRVIDANGNYAFPAAPFELIWSHQYPLGQRPKMSGRGPGKLDVFMVKIPDNKQATKAFSDAVRSGAEPSLMTPELHLCGINGNSLRCDRDIALGKVGRLWVEISVAEFTRWFLVEPDSDPSLPFRVTAGFPPPSSGIRQSSFGREAVVTSSSLLLPLLVGFFLAGLSGFVVGGVIGVFLVLVWFATGRTLNSKPSAG